MAATIRKINERSASKNAVEMLEQLLKEARSGNLISAAVVWNDTNDVAHTVYSNDSQRSGIRDLLAGSCMLRRRLEEVLSE